MGREGRWYICTKERWPGFYTCTKPTIWQRVSNKLCSLLCPSGSVTGDEAHGHRLSLKLHSPQLWLNENCQMKMERKYMTKAYKCFFFTHLSLSLSLSPRVSLSSLFTYFLSSVETQECQFIHPLLVQKPHRQPFLPLLYIYCQEHLMEAPFSNSCFLQGSH